MLKPQADDDKNALEKLGEAIGTFWNDMIPAEQQDGQQQKSESDVPPLSGPPTPPPRNSQFSPPGRPDAPSAADETSTQAASVACKSESIVAQQKWLSEMEAEQDTRSPQVKPQQEDEPPPLLPPPPPAPLPSLPSLPPPTTHIISEVSPSPPPRRRPGKPIGASTDQAPPVKPIAQEVSMQQEANVREAVLLAALSETEAAAAAEVDAINEEWGVKLNEHVARNAKLRVEIRQANRHAAELEKTIERLKKELEETASVASKALLSDLSSKASAVLPERAPPPTTPSHDVSTQVDPSDLPHDEQVGKASAVSKPSSTVNKSTTGPSLLTDNPAQEEDEEEDESTKGRIGVPELESLNAGFDSGRSPAALPRPSPKANATTSSAAVVFPHSVVSPARTQSFSAKNEVKPMSTEQIELLNSGYDSFDVRGGMPPQPAERERSRSRLASISFGSKGKTAKPSRWSSFSILGRVRSKSRSMRTLDVNADDYA